MTIDLSGARARVESRLMSDTCTITSQPTGSQAGSVDRTTGDFTRPAGTTVYTGICYFSTLGDGSPVADLGVTDALVRPRIRIPWSAGDSIEIGQLVHMDTSNDPTVVGKTYKVTAVTRTDLAVWREMSVQALETDRGV